MRRADRLFRIVQLLRRRRRAVTAAQLAERLEVSERTIYRDVRDLLLSGVPITGEAGVGYAMAPDFDLPPVMFRAIEIEALVLGARVVQGWGDDELAGAATQALEKLRAVAPPELVARFSDHRVSAHNFQASPAARQQLANLRRALREQRKVRLDYQRSDGSRSQRLVWPLGLTFMAPLWLLTAWCELRRDFRNFRLDRATKLEVLDDVFVERPGRRLEDFLRRVGVEVNERL